jgi:hypothetical protein
MSPPPTPPATFRAAADTLPPSLRPTALPLPLKLTRTPPPPFRQKRAPGPGFERFGLTHKATMPFMDILRGAMASLVRQHGHGIAFRPKVISPPPSPPPIVCTPTAAGGRGWVVKCPSPHEKLHSVPIRSRAKGAVGARGSLWPFWKKY